jgi:hypothetical protein
MLAVSSALQASVRAQQRYASLTARGDAVLSRQQPTDEPPPWATFDEPLGGDELSRARSRFDAVDGEARPAVGGASTGGDSAADAARAIGRLIGVDDPAAQATSGSPAPTGSRTTPRQPPRADSGGTASTFADPAIAAAEAATPTARNNPSTQSTSAAKESAANTTAATKTAGAKKSTAKKSTAKKSTAKKSTAKKTTAKKTTAKKSTGQKSPAKAAAEKTTPPASSSRASSSTAPATDPSTDPSTAPPAGGSGA